MLLLHPVRLCRAIGTTCPTGDGTGMEALLEQLRLLTPEVASMLNVRELRAGAFEDTFSLRDRATRKVFRLSNGFLQMTSMTLSGFYDTDGSPVTTPEFVNEEEGTVTVSFASRDDYVSIAYTSGFGIPEDLGTSDDVHENPAYRVGLNVPEWIEGIVTNAYVRLRRNAQLKPDAPKEYGFLPSLNDALKREIQTRLYGAYMRPRDGVVWSSRYIGDVV